MAAEAAHRAQVEADELAVAAWNARMGGGGPAQPSPTLAVALDRGYQYLQVRCQACREAAFIDLAEVRRPADTPVWKLEGALACKPCRENAATARRAARLSAWRASRHLMRPRRRRRLSRASFAPLRLVRDEYPSTRWSGSQYSVMSGGLGVGRISNDARSVPSNSPP